MADASPRIDICGSEGSAPAPGHTVNQQHAWLGLDPLPLSPLTPLLLTKPGVSHLGGGVGRRACLPKGAGGSWQKPGAKSVHQPHGGAQAGPGSYQAQVLACPLGWEPCSPRLGIEGVGRERCGVPGSSPHCSECPLPPAPHHESYSLSEAKPYTLHSFYQKFRYIIGLETQEPRPDPETIAK